jgi:hypothetical protein
MFHRSLAVVLAIIVLWNCPFVLAQEGSVPGSSMVDARTVRQAVALLIAGKSREARDLLEAALKSTGVTRDAAFAEAKQVICAHGIDQVGAREIYDASYWIFEFCKPDAGLSRYTLRGHPFRVAINKKTGAVTGPAPATSGSLPDVGADDYTLKFKCGE